MRHVLQLLATAKRRSKSSVLYSTQLDTDGSPFYSAYYLIMKIMDSGANHGLLLLLLLRTIYLHREAAPYDSTSLVGHSSPGVTAAKPPGRTVTGRVSSVSIWREHRSVSVAILPPAPRPQVGIGLPDDGVSSVC